MNKILLILMTRETEETCQKSDLIPALNRTAQPSPSHAIKCQPLSRKVYSSLANKNNTCVLFCLCVEINIRNQSWKKTFTLGKLKSWRFWHLLFILEWLCKTWFSAAHRVTRLLNLHIWVIFEIIFRTTLHSICWEWLSVVWLVKTQNAKNSSHHYHQC